MHMSGALSGRELACRLMARVQLISLLFAFTTVNKVKMDSGHSKM